MKFGFGDRSETDFDSTVQEANIAYPSDASLMSKVCGIEKKPIDYLVKNTRGLLPGGLGVDMKTIKEYARSYFFLPKNVDIEKRREVFRDLLTLVKQQMRPVVDIGIFLDPARIARLPWNIRRAYDQIKEQAWRYLLHNTRSVNFMQPYLVFVFGFCICLDIAWAVNLIIDQLKRLLKQ